MKKLLITISLLLICSTIIYASGSDDHDGHHEKIENDMVIRTIVPQYVELGLETLSINFGPYDEVNGNTTRTSVTVNASLGTGYTICIDAGEHYGQGNLSNTRALSNGSNDYLYYYIYKGGTNNEWGDSNYANTYPGGSGISSTGTGTPQIFHADGFLSGGQLPKAGSYNDIVRITINM